MTEPASPAAPHPAVLALPVYAATRLGLLLLAFAGAWTARQTAVGSAGEYLARWQRWDAVLFQRIAEFGYVGDPALPRDPGLPSFFPGYPLLLRAAHLVLRDWTLTGLVLSLVAGAVAAVALARLAEVEGHGPAVAERAVLYLFAAPFALFLVAGYSEPVFLALALPAWVCARERRWELAGLLAAASTFVRVSGLFLAAALAVHYLVVERRLRWSAAWLLAPVAAAGAYAGYLHYLTDDWLAWTHAQQDGFGRHFALPWDAFALTLRNGLAAGQGAEYRWSFLTEIVCVLLGVALTGVLLRLRRWAEAVYVGLSVAALACSTFFFSVSRATLLWWPLYLLLAAAAQRRRWVHLAYLGVSLPLLAALTLTFTTGFWVS